MLVHRYEISVRGRESALHERFAMLVLAEERALELAVETGREVRVYDLRRGPLAAPVLRLGKRDAS